MLNIFGEFSILLTGYSSLSTELIIDYYNLLEKEFKPEFSDALNIFISIKESNPSDLKEEVLKRINKDENFKNITKKILHLWYLGKLDKNITLTFRPLFYYEALIWKTAHAHAPGLSGGYYGYWHYKPEN